MNIIEVNLPECYDTVEILPLSDLHVGDRNCDIKAFDKFIEYVLSAPNRYLIYNGDNIDNATRNSVGDVYSSLMPPHKQKKWLQKKLEPVKDRILVFVEGNHSRRTTRDADVHIVEDIADHLGKADLYREDEAYIKLKFGRRKSSGSQMVYTIYVTHGSGGGKRPGSAVNNIELLGLGTDADIYVIGHVHKKIGYKSTIRKADLRNNNIIAEERLFVISSSWLNFGGYAVQHMLVPGAKGSAPITLYGGEKKMEVVI
jgi:predicted phosphodiesterase